MKNKNFFDMTGMKFGKLKVISRFNENTKCGNAKWICLCECGNKTIVNGAKLRNGSTISCGCYRKRKNGKSKTRIYGIWRQMHRRCENEKHDHFERYGGRGIKVCKEWADFFQFELWAFKNGYNNTLSIDRIDGDGNYEPANCRWISQKEQMNNVSTNRFILYKVKEYTISQFAELLGTAQHNIRNSLRANKDAEWMVKKYGR